MESHLLPVILDYERHANGLASVMLVAAQALLHGSPEMQRQKLRPLLMAVHPWLTCHAHQVGMGKWAGYARLPVWGGPAHVLASTTAGEAPAPACMCACMHSPTTQWVVHCTTGIVTGCIYWLYDAARSGGGGFSHSYCRLTTLFERG